MSIYITYDNVIGQIEGHIPPEAVALLWNELKYHADGYEHVWSFKAKKWDGFTRLFNTTNNSFRRGLLDRVKNILEGAGHSVLLKYHGHKPQLVQHKYIDGLVRPYDFQEKAIEAGLTHDIGLIVAPTGCHAKGQLILMYDGLLKKVEDIAVGDQLMGPESQPRNVLQLCRGKGRMVEIIPTRGEPFIVNEDHILTLQKTNEGGKGGYKESIIDVSVKDYLNWSKYKKHVYKLFRTGVTFTSKEELPIDPYFLGLLLGDGSIKHSVSLTINDADTEILKELQLQANKYNLLIRKETNFNLKLNRLSKASNYYLHSQSGTLGKNHFRNQLKKLNLFGTNKYSKFIPQVYKTCSPSLRKAILAGLIDSDGSLSSGTYDYISASKQLSTDVAYIARSIGLAANVSQCQKACTTTGYIGTYWRVCISGNISIIPSRLLGKIAGPRRQKKSVLRTGFKLKYLEEDNYYGFTLDSDGRFLLGDFTVTHNTGKGIIVSKLIAALNRYTVVILTDIVLLDQMQQVLQKYFDQPIGMIGDGEFDLQNITVTTIQSLLSITKAKSIGSADKRKFLMKFIDKVGAVISDEVHLADSESFAEVMPLFKYADKTLGTSATPYGWAEKAEKRANLELEQHFGKVIYDCRKLDFVSLNLKVPLFIDVVGRTPLNLEYKQFKKKTRHGFGFEYDWTKNYRDCFTWRTLVQTEAGLKFIGNLANDYAIGKTVPRVMTFNETTKSFEYNNIVGYLRKTPTAPLINIKFGNAAVKSTTDHKYLTIDGWKEAKTLRVGESLIGKSQNLCSRTGSGLLVPNDDQLQILIGSYLGDGSFSNRRDGVVLRETHGIRQQRYAKWKANMLGISELKYIEHNGPSGKPAVSFMTKQLYIDGDLPCPKTCVPPWMIDKMDWRAIAIWFMDDGCFSKNKDGSFSRGFFSTHSFDIDSQTKLVLKLNSLGVTCHMATVNDNGKKYNYIAMNKLGHFNLCDKIKQYVHQDLSYKLTDIPTKPEYVWSREFKAYTIQKITAIESCSYNTSGKAFDDLYDLTIENNHNYIVCGVGTKKLKHGGIVVHNCLEHEILNNPNYHEDVAKQVWNSMSQGNSSFVHAAHSIKFGEAICNLIPGARLVNGATPRLERRKIYDAMRAKELLTIVSDIGGTGLDIPSLDTMILASDLKDIRQIIGRVSRAATNKSKGTVIDIRTNCQFLQKHYTIRRSQYEDGKNTIIGNTKE